MKRTIQEYRKLFVDFSKKLELDEMNRELVKIKSRIGSVIDYYNFNEQKNG